jgi:hypothetical protein
MRFGGEHALQGGQAQAQQHHQSGEDEIVADGRASPSRPLRWQRPRWPSVFMWPTTGSMADWRRSSRLIIPNMPRFWPEMKSGAVGYLVTAVLSPRLRSRVRNAPASCATLFTDDDLALEPSRAMIKSRADKVELRELRFFTSRPHLQWRSGGSLPLSATRTWSRADGTSPSL